MRGVRSLTNRERRRLLGDLAFLTPQLVLYIGLTIAPFFIAVPVLFTDRNTFMDNDVHYVGLDNFVRLFRDDTTMQDFFSALFRTVRFTVLNYVAVYLFGMTLALLMYEIGFKGGFFTVIYLPMMISGLALGFMVVMLFSRSTGTLNLLLLQLGWIKEPVDIKLASGITVILPLMIGWQYAGFNMALFLSGLLSIPRETVEAAIVDGASYLQRLFRVYFPQMMPSFIIATIFCLIGSFGVFDQLVALGGLYMNPEAEFLSILLFMYGFSRERLALGMTLALEVGIPLLVGGLLLQWLQKRLQYEV